MDLCAWRAGACPRRGERGIGHISFLARSCLHLYFSFFFLSMQRVGGGMYKGSASGHWCPNRTSER